MEYILEKLSKEQIQGLRDRLKKLEDQYESDLAAGEPSSAEDFDEEVGDIIQTLEDNTDIVEPTADTDTRVQEIERDMSSGKTISDLEDEDRRNRKISQANDEEKLKAHKGHGGMGRGTAQRTVQAATLASTTQLKKDLEEALTEQADKWEYEYYQDYSYSHLDRHHQDIISPGEYEDVRAKAVSEMPTIDVYIDQSGSWSDYHVDRVMDVLSAISDLVYDERDNPDGKIILNVYYFSLVLSQDRDTARSQGRCECWTRCIQNILAEPVTKNVLFVTDRDILTNYVKYGGSFFTGCDGCVDGPGAHIEGFVWWLWKDKYSRVIEATKKLTGDLGCKEYVLMD